MDTSNLVMVKIISRLNERSACFGAQRLLPRDSAELFQDTQTIKADWSDIVLFLELETPKWTPGKDQLVFTTTEVSLMDKNNNALQLNGNGHLIKAILRSRGWHIL